VLRNWVYLCNVGLLLTDEDGMMSDSKKAYKNWKVQQGSDIIFPNQVWQAACAWQKASDVMPVGWKRVPIKPTRDMIDAAHNHECIDFYEAGITWEAMIAASPTPPEQEPTQ
jgi:hypothetical protein